MHISQYLVVVSRLDSIGKIGFYSYVNINIIDLNILDVHDHYIEILSYILNLQE